MEAAAATRIRSSIPTPGVKKVRTSGWWPMLVFALAIDTIQVVIAIVGAVFTAGIGSVVVGAGATIIWNIVFALWIWGNGMSILGSKQATKFVASLFSEYILAFLPMATLMMFFSRYKDKEITQDLPQTTRKATPRHNRIRPQ